jgi:hypothetical protein
MVKAIQELNEKNEQLRIKNEKLKVEKDEDIAELTIKNANLEERIAKYEEFQTMLVKRIEQLETGDQTSRIQIVNTENSNQ